MRKRVYCLDLDGLSESRGPTKGGNVYASVDELPADRDDLAAIWVHPHTVACAVELAHRPSASASGFSFQSGHRNAVARVRELAMEVIEIGSCPSTTSTTSRACTRPRR